MSFSGIFFRFSRLNKDEMNKAKEEMSEAFHEHDYSASHTILFFYELFAYLFSHLFFKIERRRDEQSK